MQLGDFFPEKLREELAQNNLQIGSVLRYLDDNSNPPKIKRKIVVGFDAKKILFAYVFINTEINPFLFPTKRLQDLHYELSSATYDFIEYDSFVDCSDLKSQDIEEVLELMKNDSSIHKGELLDSDLNAITVKLKNAFTIDSKLKKKFGLL